MESASLPANGTAIPLALTVAQRRAVESVEPLICITGAPGSGKTVALAARARAARQRGREPVVICSHPSGCRVFEEALAVLRPESSGEDSSNEEPFLVATLAEHAVRWLGGGYFGSQSTPQPAIGGRGVAPELVARAASGLLNMTWPLFARADVDLDLPYLGRPEAFLDEAASLFSLLQRTLVSPQEFEEGCSAGLAAFYGHDVERAQMLVADPAVVRRASARGREALRASAEALGAQRNAERDTAALLLQLYKDYQAVAAHAPTRPSANLLDALVAWLRIDGAARDAIVADIGEIIVDDAEDAEAALVPLLRELRQVRAVPLVLAGWEPGRIDGFEGRRSALGGFEAAARFELPPLHAAAQVTVGRFPSDAPEADWIAQRIQELLRSEVAPETIAVLTRGTDSALAYAMGLRERGVPAAKPSAALERDAEMADLLALCAVVDDPEDQEHLLRVLGSPLVGLNDASLWALCRDPAEGLQLSLDVGPQGAAAAGSAAKPGMLAHNMQSGAADGTLTESARTRVVALRERLHAWRRRCITLTPVQRFLYLAEAGGFRAQWGRSAAFERARLDEDCARVAKAVEAASYAGARDFPSIARFIEDEVVALVPARRCAGAVVTEPIVAVKADRFDHVFVAGVAHERFPRIYTSHAMAFSRTYGLIIRENVAKGASQTAKFAWYYAKFGAKGMYLDEERRALAYALSRARVSAHASGYGTPPYWARDHDLLTTLDGGRAAHAASSA